MHKYILGIDGMKCGMCESHINDLMRRNYKLKKVSSSHKKNETIMITDIDINIDDIKKLLEPTGYKLLSFNKEEAVKKGLFFK